MGNELDSHLFEFLIGALLGDGSIEKRLNKANARYAEGGSNELYLRWKYEFLQQYFSCSWKERQSLPHPKTGKSYKGWWLRTTVHPLLTKWHLEWYESHKIVPKALVEKYLTEFALAIWFCDDGYSGRFSKLYTMAFSEEEVKFLANLLRSRFGLSSRVRMNKQKQPFICFPVFESQKIREIIAPFSLPGMAYKSELGVNHPLTAL